MSNLGYTQSKWNKFARELGLGLSPEKLLTEIERRFAGEFGRTQVIEENSVNGFTSAWVLAGCKIGNTEVGAGTGNTDENGLLYVRISKDVPVGGTARVQLFRNAGAAGGDEMARADIVWPGTGALVAQNGSGLTGSVTLGVVTASESDDKHRLRVMIDYPARALPVFDGSEPEHADLLKAYETMCAQVRQRIRAAKSIVASYTSFFLGRRGRTFLNSGQGSSISKQTKNDQGLITAVNTGLFEDMRADMRDELTAPVQYVAKNTVTVGGLTFDGVNQGKGSASVGPTAEEYAQDGLVTAICVDGTIGSETFQLSQTISKTGEVRTGKDLLQKKRAYLDPNIGIRALTLIGTLTFDAGGASAHFATIADWSTLTGETKNNTADGVLYWKIVAGVIDVTKFKVQGFTSTSYSSDKLVFETDEGAANAVVNINPKSGSGFSGSGKIGTAPVAGNTATFNFNPFRTSNSQQNVADKFTFKITSTASNYGEWQRRMADQPRGYYLNSTALGGETFKEGLVSAGTFEPYSVSDA